jgi:hypothetical protein
MDSIFRMRILTLKKKGFHKIKILVQGYIELKSTVPGRTEFDLKFKASNDWKLKFYFLYTREDTDTSVELT